MVAQGMPSQRRQQFACNYYCWMQPGRRTAAELASNAITITKQCTRLHCAWVTRPPVDNHHEDDDTIHARLGVLDAHHGGS